MILNLIVNHPAACAVAAAAVALGIPAWILRYEARYQLRQRRHGGYLIGGDR